VDRLVLRRVVHRVSRVQEEIAMTVSPLAFYTAVFYSLATALLGVWWLVRVKRGAISGWHYSGRHPFWGLGLKSARPLALAWVISYALAWLVVSRDPDAMIGILKK
jgi:hypothetical protein